MGVCATIFVDDFSCPHSWSSGVTETYLSIEYYNRNEVPALFKGETRIARENNPEEISVQ